MGSIRKLAENFTETEIDDEVIIMRLDNGELLSLADSAAVAWRLIDGDRDVEALVAELEAQFAAHEQEIARDVRDLLTQLKEAGLVAEH